MTIYDDNLWWQFLMTISDDNFSWQFLMTIFEINQACIFHVTSKIFDLKKIYYLFSFFLGTIGSQIWVKGRLEFFRKFIQVWESDRPLDDAQARNAKIYFWKLWVIAFIKYTTTRGLWTIWIIFIMFRNYLCLDFLGQRGSHPIHFFISNQPVNWPR